MLDLSKFQKAVDEISLEKKWKATAKSRGMYNGEFAQVVYKKFGEEGLKIIEEVWGNIAQKTFRAGLKNFAIDGNDALSFVLFFFMANQIIGNKLEIEEGSNGKKATVRMYQCPPFPEPTKVKDGPKICEAMFGFEKAAAKLLNPKLKVYYSAKMSEGAPFCAITAELLD